MLNTTFIAGDLDNDLSTRKGDRLLSVAKDFNFINFANEPTHFQGKSATLIDVVSSNNPIVEKCCVARCSFSNHQFVSTTINLKPESKSCSSINSRFLNKTNLSKIKEDIAKVPLMMPVMCLMILMIDGIVLRNFLYIDSAALEKKF